MAKRKGKKGKRKQEEPNDGEIECISCGQPLIIPGGMAGTGLCGPCCTGDASTIEEMGETW